MKKILVTGSQGFIGNRLCQVLSAQDQQVIGFVKSPCEQRSYVNECYVADITNRELVCQLVQDIQPNQIVHLAAMKERSDAAYAAGYEINLRGTLNLLEACQSLPALDKFVFLGTCDEYGVQTVPFEESLKENPESPYGVTKLAATTLLKAAAKNHGFPAVILRPSLVYGPGQDTDMFLSSLMKTLLTGKRFAMTWGEQTRDLLYVDDVVTAITLALQAPDVTGQIINVSLGSSLRINVLAKKVAQLIDPRAETLIDFGTREYRRGEVMNYEVSNLRAQKLLNWKPCVSLEDGLRKTLTYFRALKKD